MMAATTCSSYMGGTTLSKFSMVGGGGGGRTKSDLKKLRFSISAAQPQETTPTPQVSSDDQLKQETEQENNNKKFTELRPADTQMNVKSKNMSREYGGQWLSSTTRHVRIFAAYIDPVTCAFDQTQMDKLTLILDPTNEFDWTPHTCNMVYTYFQHLVDHYEGADLTEYTLRLIGSDIEHYIRKLLYDGEIKYNMNARVLNFSMGKPRVGFSYNGETTSSTNLDDDVNQQ